MKRWFVVSLSFVMWAALPVAAEQVTATSFLPSPLGVFKNVRTTQDTWLAVNSDKNVGIGTTLPSQKLHLYGGNMLIQQTPGGVGGDLQIDNSAAATVFKILGTTGHTGIGVAPASDMALYVYDPTVGGIGGSARFATWALRGVWATATGAGSKYGIVGEANGAGPGAGKYGIYGTVSGTAGSGNWNRGVFGIVNNDDTENAHGGQFSAIQVLGTTGGSKYGVWGDASGAGANNYGGYFSASGGTNNYGLYVAEGKSYFGNLLTFGNVETPMMDMWNSPGFLTRTVIGHSPGFDVADSNLWGLAYNDSSDAFLFQSGGSTMMSIDLNGDVDINADLKIDMNELASINGVCHSGLDVDLAPASDRFLVVCAAGPGDIAEFYESSLEIESGDLVGASDALFEFEEELFDPKTGMSLGKKAPRKIFKLVKTAKPYQDDIFGIISESPYQTMGHAVRDSKDARNPQPLAIAGRVPVKVSLENGPIKAGDLLTSSSKPGYAMKATKSGRVVGMAMESFPPSVIARSEATKQSHEGKILCFVNPHHWVNPQDHQDLKAEVELLKSEMRALKADLGSPKSSSGGR